MKINEIKALEQKLEKLRSEPADIELVETLNRLANNNLHTNPHKSEIYALEAYNLAKKLGIMNEQARSNMVLGTFHLEAGNFDEALSLCQCSMEIYENLEDKHGIASVHSRLANIFLVQGLIDKALEHYLMALKKNQECDVSREEVASCYFNIGVCYATLDKLELAISFYEHAKSVWEESCNNPNLVYLYNNIGTVFGKKKKFDNAREYFLKSLDLCEKLGERKQKASTLGNLGNLHEDICEHQIALDYYSRSLELCEELGNKKGVAYACCHIGGVYTHLNRLDEAVGFAEKGLEITRMLKVKDYEILCLEKITKLYEKKGDLKKALVLSRELNTCLEEHLNEKSMEKIARLQVQFETEKKEKETEIYRMKNVELSRINDQLRKALAHVKILQGMLPICASCKKIRDDDGYWQQIESYISDHSSATFTHGICPECLIKLYGENLSQDNQLKH